MRFWGIRIAAGGLGLRFWGFEDSSSAERSSAKNCCFVEGVCANKPSSLGLYIAGIPIIQARNTLTKICCCERFVVQGLGLREIRSSGVAFRPLLTFLQGPHTAYTGVHR